MGSNSQDDVTLVVGATVGEQAGAQPPVRLASLLRLVDRAMLVLDRGLSRILPERLNPLAEAGAIANVCLIIAIATGALLMFWYSASVTHAHSSIETIDASWLAYPVRALHRYSSDACMFFVLLHAVQMAGARKLSGPRWIAWVSGIVLVLLLWFVGWTGYWLVWDERAQSVATGTALLADPLPIFSEPLSRSFLTDETLNPLFFFVIFFVHMLLPLVMGLALWLHLARVNRSRFLTNRPMTMAVVGVLVLLSVLLPADTGTRAQMTKVVGTVDADYWYLLPLAATRRVIPRAHPVRPPRFSPAPPRQRLSCLLVRTVSDPWSTSSNARPKAWRSTI